MEVGMTRTLFPALCLALIGCTTSAVTLKNPATGQTAQCGPYLVEGVGQPGSVAQREARCIDDFQNQGFVRQP
jgi:hypothetical protein